MDELLPWQKCFRDGFAKVIPRKSLESLRDALVADSPMIMQGQTTEPRSLPSTGDWPVECACPIAFCGWLGEDGVTVDEVNVFFGEMCYKADQLLGEPGGCRHVLNFVDDSERDKWRPALLAEAELALA